MITDEQVRLLRKKMKEGKKIASAAAAAGISERSAYTWKHGARTWRTRLDPFASVWQSDVVPLLQADERGVLDATTILEELRRRHTGAFAMGQVRTLQRRLHEWRALHGPEKEVMFEQKHEAGREGARLHRRDRARRHNRRRALRPSLLPVHPELQQVALGRTGILRDVRGSRSRPARRALGAPRCASRVAQRQPLGGDAPTSRSACGGANASSDGSRPSPLPTASTISVTTSTRSTPRRPTIVQRVACVEAAGV